MEAFTTFLANNYLWFLVIAIILIFALIGYFVDANKKKKGVSSIVKQKPVEKDIHDLARSAANKSLNSAINDAGRNFQNQNINQNQNLNTSYSNYNKVNNMEMPQMNNTITEMNSNQSTQNSNVNQASNSVGFDVLSK